MPVTSFLRLPALPVMVTRLALALAAIWCALFLGIPPAMAACSASSSVANLGSETSFTVQSTAVGVEASTGFYCPSGGTLTLVVFNTVSAKIATVTGNQLTLQNSTTGDKIPFSICKDSSCAQTYAIGSKIEWTSTTLLGLLGLFTGPNGTLPVYIKTAPGTHVAAGLYTNQITVEWSWDICVAGALGLCALSDTGSSVRTINVSLDVRNDCSISAPAVNFGSAAFVSSFDDVTQSLNIRCSKGASYTVGINQGLHPSGGSRHLSDGVNSIAYDLYYPASANNRWGHVGGERVSSSAATTNAGTYTGAIGQGFTYRAAITPGQPTPPGGTYTDTLTVDVAF